MARAQVVEVEGISTVVGTMVMNGGPDFSRGMKISTNLLLGGGRIAASVSVLKSANRLTWHRSLNA
jgi:hypothetical protein